MSSAAKTFVIIGAGPTGLGAALRLMERGERDFVVLEAGREPGGLASSVVDEHGFTWDLGGHVQFSHYQKFDEYMDQALGSDGWLEHERQSWVWVRGTFVPYPFQNNLHRLPPSERWRCVQGLLQARETQCEDPRTFRDWIVSTFGQGIADVFLLPYNYKVWAHPPEMMDWRWVGERVAVPEINAVIRSICLEEDQVSWGPNKTFRFPKRGGTGAVWKSLAGRIPAGLLRLDDPVATIDPERRTVTTARGNRFSYRHLISTMPLDEMLELADLGALSQLASGLRYSSTHVAGIGLAGQPPEHLAGKCWMYFPEDDCPFYRVTVFSHYSPFNAPRPGSTWSLMAEVSESAFKPVRPEGVVDQVVQGLLATKLISPGAMILSKWHHRLERGYPVPTSGRDEIVQAALSEMASRDVYSRGRFGAWKYEVSNQDHSFMQGVEVVEHIVEGMAELTLDSPDHVNSRWNVFPHPEWRNAQAVE
jgi:protoporphyrinogen oxidase